MQGLVYPYLLLLLLLLHAYYTNAMQCELHIPNSRPGRMDGRGGEGGRRRENGRQEGRSSDLGPIGMLDEEKFAASHAAALRLRTINEQPLHCCIAAALLHAACCCCCCCCMHGRV
jgi:hypothetical protein